MTATLPPDRDKKGRYMSGRRPHNARGSDYTSLPDLVQKLALAPRTVKIDGKRMTITRLERYLRMKVARATAGDPPEIADMLRLMKKHPEIANLYPTITQIIIGGAFKGI